MIDIRVDIRGNETVQQAVKLMKKKMSENAALRKIARAGRDVIVDNIRSAQRQAEKPNTRNPFDRPRRYRSSSGAVATFYVGHLERSIRDISQDKSSYRRVPYLYIGPVYTGKAGQGGQFTGAIGKADAYYAHMMLGGALFYEKRVIQKGFDSARAAASQLVLKEAEIQKNGKASGFQTR